MSEAIQISPLESIAGALVVSDDVSDAGEMKIGNAVCVSTSSLTFSKHPKNFCHS